MQKAISVALTCFMVLYLIFAPSLFEHTHDDLYTVKEEKKIQEFEGMMTLWTVSDSAFAASGITADVIKKAEKNKVRVYINKKNLTFDQAEQCLKKGERADMICFEGRSLLKADMLEEITFENKLMRSFEDAGKSEGKYFALPYMCNAEINENTAEIKTYYYCITKTEDRKKLDMCLYIAKLLSDKSTQKSIAEKGFIPVFEYEGLFETESDASSFYHAAEGELYVKNVFE